MHHIYTGDGKGKTTAAVGLAVRCAGSGRRVLFTQFLKPAKSGEIEAMDRYGEYADLALSGRVRFHLADDG